MSRAPKAFDRRAVLGVLVMGAQGLEYLHSRVPAVVHRDIKPANILVQGHATMPTAKLADFGISAAASARCAVARVCMCCVVWCVLQKRGWNRIIIQPLPPDSKPAIPSC